MDLVTRTPYRSARILCWTLLVLGVFAFGGVGAQEPLSDAPESAASDGAVELVASAFEAADYEALLDLAHRRVEITIFGQGARYSHSQAAMVLRDFFRHHPPERVELAEQSATGDGRTAMGRYWAQSGESPLSLYVSFRVMSDDEWQLGSIRIDRPSLQQLWNG